MMPLPESFNISLSEFGKSLGLDLVMEDGKCIFTVDGTIDVEIDYYEDSDYVVAWAVVGLAPEDYFVAQRARALLALNELESPNGGFSVSMDPETRLVVVHDHRQAELFDSADRLAAWTEALVDLVNLIREKFAEEYPNIDMPNEEDEEEV